MSRRGGNSGDGRRGAGDGKGSKRRNGKSADYEVGYGRPPKNRQWQPNQSGNPKGRPKGARGKHKQLLAHLQPTRTMVLEEVYQTVTLRDGTKMPAIRAVAKATIKAAVTGGALAQKTLLQLVKELEDDSARAYSGLFNQVRDYKNECEANRRHHEALGLPEPTIFPNPDELELDWETLTVTFNGPITAEGKTALDQLLAKRDQHAENVARLLSEGDGNPDAIATLLANREQQLFDAINELLPEPYRTALERRVTEDEIRRARTSLDAKGCKKEARRRRRRRRAPPAGNGSPS